MLSDAFPLRPPVAVALISGAWVALFLVLDRSGDSWQAWLLVPLCAAAIVVIRRSSAAGVITMLAAGGVAVWAGLGYGEIELLLPAMYLMTYLGRHGRSVVLGAIAVVALAAVTALRMDAPWFAVLVSTGVYGTAWAFGLIVRHRAIAATSAARESALLASVDLEEVVAKSALTARERATSQALSVLRDAVERMCTLTAHASQSGPPYAPTEVDAIRAEGERAIEQLHESLLLLDAPGDDGARGSARRTGAGERGAPSDAPDAGDAADAGVFSEARADERRLLGGVVPGWVRPVALGILLVVSVAAPVLLGETQPTLLIAAAALPLCAWAARRLPVAAGAVAAVTQLGAGLGPPFSPDAMLPMGVAFCILVWHLSSMTPWSARIALCAAIAAALFLGAQFGVRGFGFMIVSTALPLAAARVWREHDVILHDEQVRAAKLMSGIAAATRRAARTARQRLARELHDGVSHGITAMTLQAAAAQVIGDRDHEHAVRCMRLARDVGEQTLHEIDALARERHDHGIAHSAGLDSLIEGARVAGLRIERVAAAPSAESDRLTYRIVQEALTNASRYAPGARIEIEAGMRAAARFVRVTDSGAAGREPLSGSGRALQQLGLGSGLSGLAARIAERDGEFRAAPHGTGFEVFAQWAVEGPGAEAVGLPDAHPADMNASVVNQKDVHPSVVTSARRTDE